MLCCSSPSDPLAFAFALGLQSKAWVGGDVWQGELGSVPAPGEPGKVLSIPGMVPSCLLGGLKEGVLGDKPCFGRGEIPVSVPG